MLGSNQELQKAIKSISTADEVIIKYYCRNLNNLILQKK